MQPVAPSARGSPDLDVAVCRGEVLAALARVLDYRADPAVPHHGRVATLAARMASRVRGVDRREVFYAALVHDIGLVGQEHEAFTFCNLQEYANLPLVRSHPMTGAQMLASAPNMLRVAEIILDHHEWVNGHGYPRGKVGDEVSPAAQVLRFADTCDLVLREQGTPELLAFLHAVQNRSRGQVVREVADAGIEVLGETGFYDQLLTHDNVDLLVEETLTRLAMTDWTTTEAEVTSLLELIANITDFHCSDKIGHSRRVANLAVLVAMAVGLSPEETVKLRWAALVHDLWTVTVPKALFDKPRSLTEDELAEIHRHCGRHQEFLSPVNGLEDTIDIAVASQEAFDGSGYPRGLDGYKIPLGARIIAVCSTFDALTSRRPYREARDTKLAIDILIRGSGGLFDPDVVSAAVPVFLIRQPADQLEPINV